MSFRANTQLEKFRNSFLNVIFTGIISIITFIFTNDWNAFRVAWLGVFFSTKLLELGFSMEGLLVIF